MADLWPSIVWTTFTLAPAAMANDAAVPPQRVRRDSGESSSGRCLFESRAPEVAQSQGPTLRSGEDEVVERSSGDGSGELVEQEPGDGHPSGLVVLGRAEHRSAVHLGDRFGDGGAATEQVQMADAQRRELAETHPSDGLGRGGSAVGADTRRPSG